MTSPYKKGGILWFRTAYPGEDKVSEAAAGIASKVLGWVTKIEEALEEIDTARAETAPDDEEASTGEVVQDVAFETFKKVADDAVSMTKQLATEFERGNFAVLLPVGMTLLHTYQTFYGLIMEQRLKKNSPYLIVPYALSIIPAIKGDLGPFLAALNRPHIQGARGKKLWFRRKATIGLLKPLYDELESMLALAKGTEETGEVDPEFKTGMDKLRETVASAIAVIMKIMDGDVGAITQLMPLVQTAYYTFKIVYKLATQGRPGSVAPVNWAAYAAMIIPALKGDIEPYVNFQLSQGKSPYQVGSGSGEGWI